MSIAAKDLVKAILAKVKSREEPVLLWSGAWYMDKDKTISFSRNVSSFPHGMVLVFSQYSNGKAQDYGFTTHFVSKADILRHPGFGRCFLCSGMPFNPVGMKYLYLSDSHITGNDMNLEAKTRNGITYDNKAFVLREIWGV